MGRGTSVQPERIFDRGFRGGSAARGMRAIGLLVVSMVLASVAALSATILASSAPACTRSWDGGAGTTDWNTAENWDGTGEGQLPVATDHACIPAGANVDHGSGTTAIETLQSEGE